VKIAWYADPDRFEGEVVEPSAARQRVPRPVRGAVQPLALRAVDLLLDRLANVRLELVDGDCGAGCGLNAPPEL